MRAKQNAVEISDGEAVPDLLDLVEQRTDRDWLTRSIARDKVSSAKLIEFILRKSGRRWLNPLKRKGDLTLPVPLLDGRMSKWKFTLMLTKNSAGKRQLRIER